MSLISVAALALVINVVTALLKNFIYPKFGRVGVQVVVFILAAIGALYVMYGGQYPGLITFVTAAGAVFSTAVAFYEVLWNRIGWFSNGAFPAPTTPSQLG